MVGFGDLCFAGVMGGAAYGFVMFVFWVYWVEKDTSRAREYRESVAEDVKTMKADMTKKTADIRREIETLTRRSGEVDGLNRRIETMTCWVNVLHNVIALYREAMAHGVPLKVVDVEASKMGEDVNWSKNWNRRVNYDARDVYGEDGDGEDARHEADAAAGRPVHADRRGGGHEAPAKPWQRKRNPLPESE
jgi:hypothetical protein